MMTTELAGSLHPGQARRGRSGGVRRPMALVFCVLMVAVLTGACASAPKGPPFKPAPPPPENRTRVYIYRIDDRPSLATVRVTIDGQSLGVLRNFEYETIELPAGSHHLRAGMRGFAWMAWGWNEHRFRAQAGETIYLELSVRLAEQPVTGTRQLEIAGREGGGASENVFILRQSEAEARARLLQTTRLPLEDGT